jgi:hypothetical protein
MEAAFEEHLRASKISRDCIAQYVSCVRRFLKFVGADTEFDRLSPETVKAFFQQLGGGEKNKRQYPMIIGRFLRFVASGYPQSPAIRPRSRAMLDSPQMDEREGRDRDPVAIQDDKTLALRQTWAVDRLKEQKEAGEDLIAKLGRKLIDHYLYFQSRLQGGPESIDELYRLSDECRELIQTNLPLFISFSAQGRNLHSIIDEKVQK